LPHPTFTIPPQSPFIELQSVGSTNNYAREQIHAFGEKDLSLRQSLKKGLELHGLCVFAHDQVAGKGQRGKVWASQKGENIALSIIVKPTALPLSAQFQLSVCAAVAMHEFFIKYAGDETKIKWPNDLYWQDRKAGGILIENVVSAGGQWEWAIVGMGININQTIFPPDLPNPVSLKQIKGKSFKPVELARNLCYIFYEKWNIGVSKGFDKLYTQYLSLLYKRNERVKLRKENKVFETTIQSVTPTGKLVVKHSIIEEFEFGQVEWVI
jgi:BirA family transcriptional regulator, biotin operon repressor / biotin---[acetyl-CoA-carboxylase] ligase